MRVDVYDRQDGFLGTIGDDELLALKHTDELNGEDSLQIATTFHLMGGYRLVWRDHDGNAHEHICQEPVGEHDGGLTVYSDTALNSICETYYDYVEDKRPYGYTYARSLEAALEGTRWDVGTVDQGGTVPSGLRFWHQSAREAIKGITDSGGELETTVEVGGSGVTSRMVGIRAHRGSTEGRRRFEYGRDATRVRKTVYDGVYTACYAYGKSTETEGGGYSAKLTIGAVNGGKNYVEDVEALALYGRPDGKGGKAHRFCIFEDSNCDDAATLKAEALVYLRNRATPNVTYEADVIDLAQFGHGWEKVHVGDDCQLVDREFAPVLRCGGRVQKLVTDLLTGGQEVTIGTTAKTLVDIYSEQKEETRKSYSDSVDYNSAYTDQAVKEQGSKFEVTAAEIRAEVADKASKSELRQTASEISSTVQEQVETAKAEAISSANSYTSTTVTQTARDLTLQINSAKNIATDAQDAADEAKSVTDKFTFSAAGLQIEGTDGTTRSVATYTQSGFAVDADQADIGSSAGRLSIKDWGWYYESSGGSRFWQTDGTRFGGGYHAYIEGKGYSVLISPTGISYTGNGARLVFNSASAQLTVYDSSGKAWTPQWKES